MGFIKTVALDAQTAEIANNIGNFSQWVRLQLLVYGEHMGGEIHLTENQNWIYRISDPTPGGGVIIIFEAVTSKCNPFHKKGRCMICWPPNRTIEQHLEELRNHEEGWK